jgi:hypothetical protein
VRFSNEVWYWRGPAPFYFVTVPDELSRDIQAVANEVTYGWGMIPVSVTLGGSTWSTALWPKDGRYVVPIKTAVRRAEDVDEGQVVELELDIVAARRPAAR